MKTTNRPLVPDERGRWRSALAREGEGAGGRGISWRVAVLFVLAFQAAWAAGAPFRGERGAGDTGKGTKTLSLHTKDPATWRIVPGRAEGKLLYNETTGGFTFRAQRLAPDTEYTLVRCDDTPPSGQRLAVGRTGPGGDLSLAGVWHEWTKKFWLVPASEVAQAGAGGEVRLTGWHPERYLFEYKVLGLACDCDEEAPTRPRH